MIISIKNKGITLVSLVVTIIVLIILAGVSLNLILGQNGLIKKSKTASDEYNKQTATETMNLKITNVQISKYTEEQRMPTLEELARALEKDNDIQYVNGSKMVASIEDINFATAKSIFTKLKAFPYEFEINSSLQLASIDGIKIAINNPSYEQLETQLNDSIVKLAEFKKSIANYIEEAGGVKPEYTADVTNFGESINNIVAEVTKKATATAEDISEGKTAYVKGQLIQGNRQENSYSYDNISFIENKLLYSGNRVTSGSKTFTLNKGKYYIIVINQAAAGNQPYGPALYKTTLTIDNGNIRNISNDMVNTSIVDVYSDESIITVNYSGTNSSANSAFLQHVNVLIFNNEI